MLCSNVEASQYYLCVFTAYNNMFTILANMGHSDSNGFLRIQHEYRGSSAENSGRSSSLLHREEGVGSAGGGRINNLNSSPHSSIHLKKRNFAATTASESHKKMANMINTSQFNSSYNTAGTMSTPFDYHMEAQGMINDGCINPQTDELATNG